MNNENINSFNFNPTEFPFNIEISGITNCDQEYTISRKKSYCYILEYIYEGSGIVFCDNEEYHVGKGDAYILPKGSNHLYYPEKSWDKIWFNIDGTLVTNLIVAYGLENTVVFKNVNNKQMFDRLYEITVSDMPLNEIIVSAAIQFHRIIQFLYCTMKGNDTFDEKASKIKHMLDSNIYKKDVSLSAIANELHISQASVINIFKKAFNVTPYQYFTQKRLDAAASLLLNSNLQIKEIAELLCFADQPCFSNAFKKIMGISPEKYRKTNISNNLIHANTNNKFPIEELENLPFDLKVHRK